MTTVLTLRPHGGRALKRPLSAAAIAGGIAALAALAGCATHDVSAVEPAGAVPDDYRTNHPIAVEEGVQTMDVPVGIYTPTLTDNFKSNIVGFAQTFKESGSSLIAVVAPSGSPDQTVAAGIAVQAENVLRGEGIPPGQIDYRVYHAASNETDAPVRLAFSRIQGETAPCGPWTDQLSVNHDNNPYFAFGCATQQNLAAVVDDPLDLLYPRGLTPADAARRAEVLDKYRQGQAFTSDHSQEESGTIAQGVGQ